MSNTPDVTSGTPAPKPLNDPALVTDLQGLSDDDRTRLRDTFAALMNDQRLRIEYATSRCNAIATVGGVLLAAGVAGLLQVTKNDWDYFPGRLAVFVLVFGLTVTGSVVLWVWARQTNWNYPFKTVSQTWKHFYRDALPGMGKPEVPWHAGINDEFRTKKQEQFAEGRAGLVDRSLSLHDPSVSLAQDIEQAYLLHWTDLYKNQFLTSLRKVLVRGVLGILGAALVAFVIAAFVAGDYYDGKRGPSSTTPTQKATTHK